MDISGLDTDEWAEILRNDDEFAEQHSGSYAQRRFRLLWGQRFDAFRTVVLQQDTKRFDGNEIGHFIKYYFRQYQPRLASTDDEDEDEEECDGVDNSATDITLRVKWSYHLLVKVLSVIKLRSSYKWLDLTLTLGQELRAKGAIEDTLKDGYSSKQVVIPRDQAIGVYFVRRISRGILLHALGGNMPSWDSTILFTLAVVLQSALSCRQGDILAPNHTEDWPRDQTPCLIYRDVVLVLEGGITIKDIKGEWTIRNAKGSNGDPAKAYKLNRHALLDNNDNSLCPVRLILINAMRHGNAKGGNTIEAIIAQATTDPLKRIEWVDPELPVFSHVTLAHTVSRSEPMRTRNMMMAFPLIQVIVDANITIRSHDLRYGAAEDLIRTERGQHMNVREVAQELNHSSASVARGVTRRYTKKSTIQDFWQERVNLPDERPTFSSVVFNSDRTIQPQSGEKRNLCETESVIYANGADFINHLAQVACQSPPIVRQLPQTASTPIRHHMLPRAGTFSTKGTFPCKEKRCCIDPSEAFHELKYLQMHELKFHNKYLSAPCPIFGCHEKEPFPTFELLASHIEEHLEPQRQKARDAYFVTCRVEKCAATFPRNTIHLYEKHLRDFHQMRRAIATKKERGDNTHLCLFPECDHEERFPNGGHAAGAGAPYATHLADVHNVRTFHARFIYVFHMYVNKTSWLQHVLPLLVDGLQAVLEEEESEPVPMLGIKRVCTLPGCNKKGKKECKNKRALQDHVVSQHSECYPAACPVFGCTVTGIASYRHLDEHMKDQHLRHALRLYGTDMAIQCRFTECTSVHTDKSNYVTHLKKVHKINDPSLFDSEKPSLHSCYVEGCDATYKFTTPAEYQTHLIQIHGLLDADQRRIFLKGTVYRWVENYSAIVYNARFPLT